MRLKIQKHPYAGSPPYVDKMTSIKAAGYMMDAARNLRTKVYWAIRSCGGCGTTDDSMARSLDMPLNTYRPRRRELELLGLVEDSGNEVRLLSGRWATQWRALDHPLDQPLPTPPKSITSKHKYSLLLAENRSLKRKLRVANKTIFSLTCTIVDLRK